MDGLKPWQMVLLVVAVLVLAGSLWFTLSGPKVMEPNRIMLADIENGEMFYVKTSGKRLAILPAKNPDTGDRTLYPVDKDENGEWVIVPLMMGSLERYEGEALAVPDFSSRLVVVSDASPRAISN